MNWLLFYSGSKPIFIGTIYPIAVYVVAYTVGYNGGSNDCLQAPETTHRHKYRLPVPLELYRFKSSCTYNFNKPQRKRILAGPRICRERWQWLALFFNRMVQSTYMSIDTKGNTTGTWGLSLCFLRGFVLQVGLTYRFILLRVAVPILY